MVALIDDEETDWDRKDTFKETMNFIEKLCNTATPKSINTERFRADQLEKAIEMARFAATWEKDITKFHSQLSRTLMHESRDLEKDLTQEMET